MDCASPTRSKILLNHRLPGSAWFVCATVLSVPSIPFLPKNKIGKGEDPCFRSWAYPYERDESRQRLSFSSNVATYCCQTDALLFVQHEASYCCPTGVLLFFQQHAAAYCSPHPPSTARQARGRTSGTPDRTRGSLYVSLLHPPITARQARGPHQRNIRTRA